MGEHPIQGLMKTAMESIKGMVDVNTVVGSPVEAKDGSVIIPVSRVAFGFAAGGGDYDSASRSGEDDGGNGQSHPFAGGSGAGVSVQPVGFLVVGQGDVRLLAVDGSAVLDRLIDVAPTVIGQLQNMMRSSKNLEHADRSAFGTSQPGTAEGYKV